MKKVELVPIKHPNLMRSYWIKEKHIVFLIFFFGILFNGAVSLGPVLQGKLIDVLVNQEPFLNLLKASLTFLGVLSLIQMMRYFKRYYVRRFANRTGATMRKMIYHSMNHENLTHLSKENSGDLLVKAVQDVDLCVEGMRKVTTEVFDTGVLMISYFVALFIYDVQITLFVSIFIILSMIVAEKMKKVVVKTNKVARNENSKVAQSIMNQIEHVSLFRILGREEANLSEFNQDLTQLEKATVRAEVLETSMQPLYNAIALIGVGIILIQGSENVFGNVWSVGDFSAVLSIYVALAIKASKAGKLFNSYQKARVSWLRIQPYLKEYEAWDSNDEIEIVSLIKVKNCGFRYPETDKYIFTGFSGEFKKGQIIGITGPVACGKSTLGLALEGLYPYEGSIQIDGKELSSFSSQERANLITRLPHDPELFSQSIEENIRMGKCGDVYPVLQEVDFIQDLSQIKNGIRAHVGSRGSELSGGQRARVALARTLYRNTPILILDDPLSAVDKETEKKIMASFRQKYNESIIFLISHRLENFSELDQVIVMDGEGGFITGTHEEIINASELYKNLVKGGKKDEELYHETDSEGWKEKSFN